MKKKKLIYILLFIILLLALIISGILFFLLKPSSKATVVKGEANKVVIPSLKIIDETSDSRSIAVMINNHNYARPNHAGLQDAYVVYEVIVEGGITRLMAIFKDANTEHIGSVRSSRHNFLDYALEYDAIYVHYGWSKFAKNDISKFKVNNINGLYDSGFWRDKTLKVPSEHTAFTNIENIISTASKKGYRLTSNEELPLHYRVFPVNINTEDSIKADKVSIPYSSYMTTSYTYDENTRLYLRFANGKEHTDAITKKQYTAKNIIIMKVKNYSIDSYGRQNLDTAGSGEGYYITNGYARKITWKKESRTSKTIYQYLDGTEVILNDGNTFIQVQPIDKKTSITSLETSAS